MSQVSNRDYAGLFRRSLTGLAQQKGPLTPNDCYRLLEMSTGYLSLKQIMDIYEEVASSHPLRELMPLDRLKEEGILIRGDLVINNRTKEVVIGGRQTPLLTPIQYSLLCLLASDVGKVFSSQEIVEKVWGYPSSDLGIIVSLRIHVKNLRRKIEEDPSHPKHIVTVGNYGYRWVV